MKQLHFLKHGRGQLYVADQGNYRFQVAYVPHRTHKAAGGMWSASVHARAGNLQLDRSNHATKSEAIDWCSRQLKYLLDADVSKAEQRKAWKG